jgi:uncharacterized membrane protein
MLMPMEMQQSDIARMILAAGLACVFIAFGIDKFLNPVLWVGWIPPWLQGATGMSAEAWLPWIGGGEVAAGILTLIPKRRLQNAGTILIILFLLAVLPIVGWNETGIRDIGLLLSAVALLMLL